MSWTALPTKNIFLQSSPPSFSQIRMDGLTGSRLVILATCPHARQTWDFAFRLLLLEQLPGILEDGLEVSTFRVNVLLNQYQFVTIDRVNNDPVFYSVYLLIPYWIRTLSVSIWEWIGEVTDTIGIDLDDGDLLEDGAGELIEFL